MHLNRVKRIVLSSSLSVFMVGCGAPSYAPSEMHMTVEEVEATAPVAASAIPALVKASPSLPVIGDSAPADTFDVIVVNQPVRDLLFALARDSGIDMDVDSSVGGIVTMNALDQTLDAILDRIALQVPIRIDRVGDAYVINNDEPYYERYHVDYLSIARGYTSDSDTGGLSGGTSSISNEAENEFWENLENSIRAILSVELEPADNSGAVVGADEITAENDESQARFTGENEFDFNKDTGILMVYAPSRLQKQVEQYLSESIAIARRQVLLEATVVEVVLNNQYRQGIDWSAFNQFAREGLDFYKGSNLGGAAAIVNEVFETFTQTDTRTFPAGQGTAIRNESDLRNSRTNPAFNDFVKDTPVSNAKVNNRTIEVEEITDPNGNLVGYTVSRELTYTRPNEEANAARGGGLIPTNPSVPGAAFTAAYRKGDVSAAVQLLNTFGDAKVLSSPRISVLNNQPALLRVVDQEVYFSIEVNESLNAETGAVATRSYNVAENTVDVGFAMNVLPHITDHEEVFLNLKPSVTRVLDYRQAPVPPSLGGASGSVQNFVPVTRVRELESVMSLRDGEIAVMGGLLEDRVGDNNTAVPGLSRLPGIGALFQNTNEQTYKTEFVVFIKARVITNPSIHADYEDYQSLLPDSDFIQRDRANAGLPPRQINPR